MFNAPRSAQNRYVGTPAFGGSFVDEVSNPLSSSYDGYDPWSGTTTPLPSEAPSALNSVIGNATLPPIYNQSFSIIDPNTTGETSVNLLVKVLETSSLPSSTIERIVSLVSSKPRVTKIEFFVALALVGLAQRGKDISIEQVVVLAKQDDLPEPNLDLGSVSVSSTLRQTSFPSLMRPPAPAYSEEDPWNNASRVANANGNGPVPASAIEGSGLPREWWKRPARVSVTTIGQQGFILNRYMVYQIQSERAAPVSRRYSEFVILWDCLVKRYPFRILVSLPPKRLGPDESFIEQRRKGLSRFLNYIVNHPVIKDDGLLSVFLTEPSFEAWRRQHSVSLEEESTSKRIDRVEEMSIPSDLEDKLNLTRNKIQPVIEQWQKICFVAERLVKRREGEAADFSRLAITLKAHNEVNAACWRGENCELCGGVREGLESVSSHLQSTASVSEERARAVWLSSLEALKAQRDLYLAVRDLFIRHDRQSLDQVERLRKRIDQSSLKLEGVRSAQKEGWQTETDRLAGLIEKDQAAIAAALARRVFIRYCMWHELRVVLHNRENALLTQAIQTFAKEEAVFSEHIHSIWSSMARAVETMPME